MAITSRTLSLVYILWSLSFLALLRLYSTVRWESGRSSGITRRRASYWNSERQLQQSNFLWVFTLGVYRSDRYIARSSSLIANLALQSSQEDRRGTTNTSSYTWRFQYFRFLVKYRETTSSLLPSLKSLCRTILTMALMFAWGKIPCTSLKLIDSQILYSV